MSVLGKSVQTDDSISIPVATEAFTAEAQTVTGNRPQGRVFTEDEVEHIRKQEKDKLYKKLDDYDSRAKQLEEQLTVLSQERETSRKEAEERAKSEHDAHREREEAELSAKDLLLKKESEWKQHLSDVEKHWQEKLDTIEQQRQAQEAILHRERELQQLEQYRQKRTQEEQENIIPELLDMIAGNSVEDIEAAINVLTERSNAIMVSIQQATQSNPGRLRGAPVTAPPVGPMETQQEYQTLTAADLASMPMDQYIKNRERLLAASRNPRGRF